MPEIPSDHWLLNPNAPKESEAAAQDPVLPIVARFLEADALGKEGDDEAVDRSVDLQNELARVTATTIAGLRAQIEQFRPFLEEFDAIAGRSGGAGHIAANHAAAIEKALAAGVTAATLPSLREHLDHLGELVEGFVDSGTCGSWFDSIVQGFETLVGKRESEPATMPARPPLSEPEKTKFRTRTEVLAAGLAAPLPSGDAGLIEARQRLPDRERSGRRRSIRIPDRPGQRRGNSRGHYRAGGG
jgi:hypothetical protein